MHIRALRILPPLAIARLGGADEPLDNYRLDEDPDQPLGYRAIVPEPTLVVDIGTGEIVGTRTPDAIDWKTDGRIRPVAPFLELFAETEAGALEPLTVDHLKALGVSADAIEWRVTVANRKVERRTGDPRDRVAADTGWFGGHHAQPLEGHSPNFVSETAHIAFGHAQYIRPTGTFPEIRLRLTPGKGLIYGTKQPTTDPVIPPERAIYDPARGRWHGFGGEAAAAASAGDSAAGGQWVNETLPPSLYAIDPPAPSWLYDNVAVSRGYLDDAGDGFVEARLTLPDGRTLTATARWCAAPPIVAPDSLFVRSLADDLEQVVHGTRVPEEEPDDAIRARAAEIVRRAYETVRFMNVAVMNGNDVDGRPALSLDSMPEEEAADTERAIRPVMGAETVDTFAIMGLHEQVYAALKGGAAPWFLRLLRQPDEVADFTDRGRRRMPALMCGADNNYLALTWRQIDTIRRAATLDPGPVGDLPPPPALTPRNLTAQLNYAAAGNPISARPVTSVANCCPGLEMDFRAVWRRMFVGLTLREYDNLVVDVDVDAPAEVRAMKGHRLLRVFPAGDLAGIPMITRIYGPASSDPDGAILLTTDANPHGIAQLEWSNALARVLEAHKGQPVRCDFSKDEAWDVQQDWSEDSIISLEIPVRAFFEDDTAVIARALAEAGELTQGLCSPWQNDYRECSCYYWASARPDFVNMEPGPDGLASGDNWFQKDRTGIYVPDDYADSRLILYDDLFAHWETWLRIQLKGRDAPGELTAEPAGGLP
jgi:hypothetical protein